MTIVLGIIIGIVMGLTGAGGALIAIPLFLQFLGMELKEATLYSLIAVIIASFSNFMLQRKFSVYKLSIAFVLLSTMGSFLTNPIKEYLPDIYMAILLAAVSMYSLYSIWKPSSGNNSQNKSPSWVTTGVIGLSLGALTTLTGLGGGVLMLPLLMRFYGYDQNRAVTTSLFTVAMSSLSSLLIQVSSGAQFKIDSQLLGLVVGILVAAFSIKYMTARLPQSVLNNSRKVIFTIVVFLALFKIFN